MGRLKIAVLGLGNISKRHIKNMGSRADLVLVGRSLDRAESFKALMQLASAEVRSYEDLRRSDDLNAIIICTPPQQHCQQIEELWSTGASLLVEKPLCTSPEELLKIERLQSKPLRSNQFLMVGENYYYKPSTIFLRERIRSGALGDIKHIRVAKGSEQKSSDWRQAYGSLLEGGVHYLALLHDLMDAAGAPLQGPIKSTIAVPQGMNVERESHVIQRGGSLTAELIYSWCRPVLLKGLFQWSFVEGSRGKITFETNGILEISSRFFPMIQVNIRDIAGFQGLMNDLLLCLETGRTPYSDFKRAARDLHVPFEVYRAHGLSSEGRVVKDISAVSTKSATA